MLSFKPAQLYALNLESFADSMISHRAISKRERRIIADRLKD
ncbi:MAG: hypothetical protein RLY14_3473 [Planctomycetota bacterium]|jgi:hypothetical protein